MHTTTKPERRVAAIGASLALLTCSLIGCAPDPAPTPTPTPAFASEDEAFAAAEEVYRAYNEALNAERTGDASVDSFEYLTGLVLEQETRTAKELRDSDVRIHGSTKITQFQALTAVLDPPVAEVTAYVCLDIGGVRAIDASGSDVTAAGRSDTYAVEVSFTGDESSLLIAQYEVRTDIEC